MKQNIINFCHSIGLDTVGMISCRRFDELQDFLMNRQKNNIQNEFEENDIEKRINPMHYMEDAKTIISIAFPYYDGGDTSENGFSIYTKRYDYHRVVRNYLDKICAYIESLGGKAIPMVDSNTLPERYIAYLAGIGFIGRNNMLITKKYGSYVFLGEIITDLNMECKDSRTFSQINKNKINPNICLSYITQKKEISDREISLLKGNVFGCDFCQLKCPYNERAEQSGILEFCELDYMNSEIREFAQMDNKFFKEKVSMTSCGWRGKNVIKRNALIHMHRKGEDISNLKGDSPYINGYVERLTQNKKNTEEKHES